jgi:hypothetical protein
MDAQDLSCRRGRCGDKSLMGYEVDRQSKIDTAPVMGVTHGQLYPSRP